MASKLVTCALTVVVTGGSILQLEGQGRSRVTLHLLWLAFPLLAHRMHLLVLEVLENGAFRLPLTAWVAQLLLITLHFCQARTRHRFPLRRSIRPLCCLAPPDLSVRRAEPCEDRYRHHGLITLLSLHQIPPSVRHRPL